jgi:hypothetical protein
MNARWLVLLLGSGCASSELSLDQQRTSELDGGAIAVIDSGIWFRNVGCPSPDPSTCLHEASFWIDLRIRNDAYDKDVGIVWIDRVREEATSAWHVAAASYEGAADSGFERWGVDVSARVIGGNEPRPQIQFAAYVEMAGDTVWDNNGGADHRID